MHFDVEQNLMYVMIQKLGFDFIVYTFYQANIIFLFSVPNTQVIFLLGHVGNDTIPLQINVTKESETFGDILQEDFIDSYANLTLKTLMMLKWYNQSCSSNVPYILKTDDDVYINLQNLQKLVKLNKIPNLLMGTLICGATPIRDPYNKWFSPEYMYNKKR